MSHQRGRSIKGSPNRSEILSLKRSGELKQTVFFPMDFTKRVAHIIADNVNSELIPWLKRLSIDMLNRMTADICSDLQWLILSALGVGGDT